MLTRFQAFTGRIAERPLHLALLIGAGAWLLFAFRLGVPTKLNFDESHYVPAAKALLTLDVPRNTEHPLVAKELIAAGIAIFGDNPWGWRLIPTLFGAATVSGLFTLMWLMFRNTRTAVLASALLVLNQMVFIQARIAMLDVFLGAFVLWAMVALIWAASGTPKQVLKRWVLGSVLLGLAVGVKWAAIPYVAMAGMAFVILRIRDARRAKKSVLSALSAQGQPHWAGLGTIQGLLLMGVVSIAVYLISFAPAFFYRVNPITFSTMIAYQVDMYAQQTQTLAAHTYQSEWYQWPLISRPIWYFYEQDAGAQRGVLLVGNPLIMWAGVLAVVLCAITWLETKALRAGVVAAMWIASVAIYIVIPKSLGFYYYYYLSSIFICMALPIALDALDPKRKMNLAEWFTALASLFFLYFYPIIAAMPLEGDQSFRTWMWFQSWL